MRGLRNRTEGFNRFAARLEPLNAERRRELLDAAWAQSRSSARGGIGRARRASRPIAQTAVAATVAWLIARQVLGHPNPFFAPVSAIMSLGATRGQRARQAVELMLGVALGIGLGDLVIHFLGIGVAQLGCIVAVAMLTAVLLGAGRILLTEAAVSATLVGTIAPTTQGYVPTRLLDALTGGAVALIFSQVLFPVHPVRVAQDAARAVLDELAETLSDVAASLRSRELDAAEDALVRARRVTNDWGRFEQALDAGREAARFSPRRRRLRSRYNAYRAVGHPIDLMVTDVHVLARAAVRALTIGDPVPEPLIVALDDLAAASGKISGQLGGSDQADEIRELALRATSVATAVAESANSISATVLIGHAQATAADILRATGVDREPAHELVGRAATAADEVG